MSQLNIDRRNLITSGVVATVGAAVATTTTDANAQSPVATAPRTFTPEALPFDPKAIAGLSEKLLVSHHDNNYVGAVKRLGAIANQFAALDPATAPGYMVNGLKREELIAWNSMILHEIYFSGLGAPTRPGAALAGAIERDFGSLDRWTAEFKSIGKALGGGSGWVMLTYSHRDGRLVNQWAADHTMALASSSPIVVLDMYEHAYAMDYGARAGAYVDAVVATLNWSSADKRFSRAAT